MQLTATRDMRYAGRRVRKGETFEASAAHATVLIATRKALDALRPTGELTTEERRLRALATG